LLPLKDNIPTRVFPIVTVVVILINVVVYWGFEHAGVFSGPTDQTFLVHYSAIPYEITHPGKLCGERARVGPERQVVTSKGGTLCEGKTEQFVGTQTGQQVRARVVRVVDRNQPPTWFTVLSSMFMHGGFLHIAGNMLFLWIFGNNIEDAMGRIKFIFFYLAGGIVAALAQTAIDPSSATPTLGASGAIAAVLGGYALLYPRARVVTLIFIIFFITVIELPALAVLGVWFILQLVSASSQTLGHAGGTVAYFAHIGGFAFGLLTVKLLASHYDRDYDRHSRSPVY
jgi:membrane associated rhomboid family serine protease